MNTSKRLALHFQIELSSEFIPCPKLRVVDVPARRGLFEKLAGKKNSIVGLNPGVTIYLPSCFDTRPVADEPRAAVAGWDEQKPWNGIHAVSQTFPPLHNHVSRNRHPLWKFRLQPRMHVGEIYRTRSSIGYHSEIV